MKSLLIANRGEIACRIIRSAKRRGIRTIAVYSDADKQALHVRMADDAVYIGASLATESYLSVERIIAAAQSSGADAIHPGYGFLSENPVLVEACEQAGIIFIGPSADAMRAMGLKDAAKALMEKAGVPVVPGYHGESQDETALLEHATRIGFPVLIKARAGGGGKGMRKVDAAADFHVALASAQREAAASFGDPCVLIEKYILEPRHIEVQVFGDKHGNVVHLFERDCSLQRRHQKVIEEAPAPGMTESVRKAMTEAAVAAAKAIGYHGAGTVEFIVDGSQALRVDGFWFMEMNTRLQVEHPVTETITGIDLVDWQLQIAEGHELPLRQDQIHILGHAVEARLYAEVPKNNFLPATGTLARLSFSAQGRVDSGVVQGNEVLSYYDPMLAKLIAHADTRASAFQQLGSQLADSIVMGMDTNREFLWQLVTHPAVQAGEFDTTFIDVHLEELTDDKHLPELVAMACVELVAPGFFGDSRPGAYSDEYLSQHHGNGKSQQPVVYESVAQVLGVWQLWGAVSRHLQLWVEGNLCDFALQSQRGPDGDTGWHVSSNAMPGFPASGIFLAGSQSARGRGLVLLAGHRVHVQRGPHSLTLEQPLLGQSEKMAGAANSVSSPMPGRIVAIHCEPGDAVKAGQAVVSVEAMKMEQELCVERDGVIEDIQVAVGAQVAAGQDLLTLKRLPDTETVRE